MIARLCISAILIFSPLLAQSRAPARSNIPVDLAFFRSCFPHSSASEKSLRRLPGLYQVENYGLWIDGDALRYFTRLTLRATGSGKLELRFTSIPNFHVIGASATVEQHPYQGAEAYSLSVNGVYSKPPLVTVRIEQGRFSFESRMEARDSCASW